VLEFASMKEFTRDCGPKEKDEPIEPRYLKPDGEGRLGIDGSLCWFEGGIDPVFCVDSMK
jgi:hypothetical protein